MHVIGVMLRVSCILVLASLAACHRDPSGSPGADPNLQDHAGTTQITSGELTANDVAVDKVVTTRCAREVTCSNVGPDKHFTDGDHCVKELHQRLSQDLGTNDCPDGVNATELDHCLDAIRAESCTNAISTIQRLAQCRIGTLCMKPQGRPMGF